MSQNLKLTTWSENRNLVAVPYFICQLSFFINIIVLDQIQRSYNYNLVSDIYLLRVSVFKNVDSLWAMATHLIKTSPDLFLEYRLFL